MIENLVAVLNSEVGLSIEEIADILWLASFRQRHSRSLSNHSNASTFEAPQNNYSSSLVSQASESLLKNSPAYSHDLRSSSEIKQSFQSGVFPIKSENQNMGSQLDLFDKPFRFLGAPAFREHRHFMKALRPLLQGREGRNSVVLDEVATVNKIVDENIWMPVFKEVPEPWLDLAFVVEESVSMLIWRQTILELRHFLKNYGLFRDVRTWGLLTDNQGLIRVRSGFGAEVNSRDLNTPSTILDPEGRRLIILVSDCVSPIWYTGQILPTLHRWSNHGPMALLQMLPEWLWDRTALRQASSVFLKGLEPGISNQKLTVFHRFDELLSGETNIPHSQIKMPVLTLEPKMALAWSRMISGRGGVLAPGFVFNNVLSLDQDEVSSEDLGEISNSPKSPTTKERVEQFWLVASSTAWNLIGLLAATPTISLPVIRLIQETLLPESRQVHVAEVMLGSLLKPIDGESIRAETDPDSVTYQFVDPEIRTLLLDSSSVKDTVSVLSYYIERHFGRSLDNFLAYLRDLDGNALEKSVRPFAIVASEVLSRQGTRYKELVEAVEQKYGKRFDQLQGISSSYQKLEDLTFTTAQLVEAEYETWPPPLQVEEFTVATISVDPVTQSTIKLEPFTFKIGTLVKLGRTWEVHKSNGRAYRYVEQIDEHVRLEMVAITGGEFMMGSPPDEPKLLVSESPQHLVTVPDFYLGRYPVTQAQWRSVAAMDQVKRELNPDPSDFKGDTRPVEKISWVEAIEFCARLSKFTKRQYRLPTEAEWEYACRAGTTTPFHFGMKLDPRIANYKKQHYMVGYTTSVGSFEIANNYGLYDMHGNVWEWCEDHWHRNYEGAPRDGSAWIDSGALEFAPRIMRGGSWINVNESCRSAFRNNIKANQQSKRIGFRTVCQ
jgi:formylglycine-generating enzyme required for sulfatase activity